MRIGIVLAATEINQWNTGLPSKLANHGGNGGGNSSDQQQDDRERFHAGHEI
jgi:hypothetical protein